MMQRIWPSAASGAVDQAGLEDLYDYPSDRPTWLAVNFVCSADGAVEIAGRSRALSNSTDRQVYPIGSDLADVILVGATTAITDEFRGIKPTEELVALRERHGLAGVPRIAVVTSGNSLPPDSPVITDVHTPTIVLTCASASPELREAWASAGAEVILAGTETVDLGSAADALAQRGLTRIHCDGGPSVFAAALAAGIVDELRLTISPLLVAGTAERIANGTSIPPTALTLDSVLAEDDTLLLRYLLKR